MNLENTLLFISSFLLFFATKTGALENENIIGSEKGNIDRFPYHVYVGSTKANFIDNCNGGIIGKKHVITAAHCIIDDNGKPSKDIKVIGGVSHLNEYSKSRVEIKVKDFCIPQEFYENRNSSEADIAVLKINGKFDFDDNKNIGKLILPYLKEHFEKKEAILASFGLDTVVGKTCKTSEKIDLKVSRSCKLHFKTVDILERKDWPKGYKLSNANFLARTTPSVGEIVSGAVITAATTYGDSGSPLVYQKGKTNILIRILSKSHPELHENKYPTIYVMVGYYKSFIEDAMKRQSMCTVQ